MTHQIDKHHMRRALELARTGLGRTAPNPAVGCVIAYDETVIAEARTADLGRPHAEARALKQAGDQAKGATAYVTLEPCSHHGKTPPCAQALIDARIGRVVIACEDSDPRVKGKGIDMLKEAGIGVECGVYEAEARALNVGFFTRIEKGRPWVTLKMAVSADGKIAGRHGQPVQISGQESRIHMHTTLRATHDAIMVGMGTAVRDDPLLTTRYQAAESRGHTPLRIVCGDERRLPDDARLRCSSEDGALLILPSGDPSHVLTHLAEEYGITRLLIEGGASLMQSYLSARVWDQLYVYHGPSTLGEHAINAPDFSAFSADMQLQETQNIGADRLAIYAARD